MFRLASMHNTPAPFGEERKLTTHIRPEPDALSGRMLAAKAPVQIINLAEDPLYTERKRPPYIAAVELGGARTALAVPMLKDHELIGMIMLSRQEVRAFTEKQIALIENFAAQAVIAIENARLLNELRQRTSDLSEALEQQTATSEVLQVISGSPGDLQPVFAAMLDKAARLCDANFGNIFRWDGNALWLVATHNTPPAFTEHRKRVPFRPNQSNPIGQMLDEEGCLLSVVQLLTSAMLAPMASRPYDANARPV